MKILRDFRLKLNNSASKGVFDFRAQERNKVQIDIKYK